MQTMINDESRQPHYIEQIHSMTPKFRLRISVTQAMINEGIKLDCKKCPVALAVLSAIALTNSDLRTFPVHVGRQYIEIGRWGCPTTDKIRWFTVDFDNGEKVVPFVDILTFRDRFMEDIRFF